MENPEVDAPALTDEHWTELDYRIAKYAENPSDVIPWGQVRAGLFRGLFDRECRRGRISLRRQIAQILRPVLEPRLGMQEHQVDLPDRPVALFGQNQLRQPL